MESGSLLTELFQKTVVLNACRRVPMRHEKLKSYLPKYILESVAIPLDTDEQGLKQFFSDVFQDKMDGDKWQLLPKYLLNARSKKMLE